MAAQREKFSSRVSPELLTNVREIARIDGRQFQAILEDAWSSYIQARELNIRPEVMA